MSQEELAATFAVSRETIREWQAAGLPYEIRAAIGEENLYDTGKAITWVVRRELSRQAGGETAKDRLARVQADRIEIEIEKERGRLIPVEQIEPEWTRAITAARSFALSMPERWAPLLQTTPDVAGKRDLLAEFMDQFLNKLALYEDLTGASAGPEGMGAVQATGPDDGRAMGGGEALPQ